MYTYYNFIIIVAEFTCYEKSKGIIHDNLEEDTIYLRHVNNMLL